MSYAALLLGGKYPSLRFLYNIGLIFPIWPQRELTRSRVEDRGTTGLTTGGEYCLYTESGRTMLWVFSPLSIVLRNNIFVIIKINSCGQMMMMMVNGVKENLEP